MRKINKKTLGMKFLIAGILSVMLISIVSAIGVGGINSPMRLYPGEERIALLKLSNIESEDTLTIGGNILEGSEIASLDRDSYKVPYYKSANVEAKMTIKIPESAIVGQTYRVSYEFKQSSNAETESESTGASFVTGVKSGFDVEVIEKPTQQPTPEPETPQGMSTGWIVLIIAVVLAVIIVLYFLIRKKK